MHFQLQQFVSLILLMISSWATVGGLASPIGSPQELAKRAPGDVHLYKRFTNSKWSFYDVGLGACGEWNVESDFIVALNAEQFGSGYPGPHCGKTITLRYNGKTAQAKIMDRCPGCPYGGLDLSRSLFRHFAHEDLGIIYGSWDFGSGGGDNAPATTQAPAPPTTTPRTTSTPAPAPEPTTTRRTTTSPPPAPTTTQAPVTTTSSTPTTRAPEPVPTTSRTPAVNIVVSSYSSSASASSSAAFLEDVVPSTVIAAAAPLPTESGTLEEKLQENWTLITQLFEMLGKLIQSLAGGEDAPAASASA
ncbi:hypothetical protein CC1G_11527 [Coprinopsis cinerea okayama7|uniref:Expansin family protein n=1 Tax=Coprinopsis cinerea (strain Okayama-7 / 130 / ATCC MYA-4618 / FGSC 9003) TaxID=240176 RepID=A8NHD5_COPC7|nr:hypothetical protein CC1G_11527 [Coprinopsis cinerea okayama7\|eukprot:XP_001833742.2 hypothetical protein CC1G_11527 [Coprinopsis cinerea okayama7\